MRLRRLLRPSLDRSVGLSSDGPDGRPVFAIGHIPVAAADIGRLADFYSSIGCRNVVRLPGVAILELRGGTHLAISKGASGQTTLDLMVDDLADARETLAAAGADPSPITRRLPHRVFTASDPEGNRLIVHDSHVAGVV